MKSTQDLTERQRFYSNHWSMFGAAALLLKVKGGWLIEMGQYSPPVVYKTKREAMDMVTRIVLAFRRED